LLSENHFKRGAGTFLLREYIIMELNDSELTIIEAFMLNLPQSMSPQVSLDMYDLKNLMLRLSEYGRAKRIEKIYTHILLGNNSNPELFMNFYSPYLIFLVETNGNLSKEKLITLINSVPTPLDQEEFKRRILQEWVRLMIKTDSVELQKALDDRYFVDALARAQLLEIILKDESERIKINPKVEYAEVPKKSEDYSTGLGKFGDTLFIQRIRELEAQIDNLKP
jgi:hypothetical protein